MPPITKIQKEDILEAAYDIARIEGMEGVNARAIAKKLNCSIQPIFHKFSNMEDLKKQLEEKILKTYENYLNQESKTESPYKAIGMNYIRFAKEEPKLFQIIFMSEHQLSIDDFIGNDKNFEMVEKNIHRVTGLSGEDIKQFHRKIWIFTYGMASLMATHTCEFSEEQISQMLTDAFKAFYEQEKRKGEEKYE